MGFRPIVFIGFIGLLLIGAYSLPTVIADTNDRRTTTLTLDVAEETDVYNDLNATLDAATSDNATVEVKNADSGATVTDTIDVGNTRTFDLEGDEVNVTVDSTSASTNATLTIGYAPTFGYDDGTRFLIENLGAIVMGMFVILIFSLGWTAI